MSRALEAFICLVVERELNNRGITAQNLDQWELITYPEKLMVEGKSARSGGQRRSFAL